MASSSAPLTAAEAQQLQKLLAKAKSAAMPADSSLSLPHPSVSFDPVSGQMFHHEFAVSESVWDAAESWLESVESDFEATGGMTDAAKRREADDRQSGEHQTKRLTMSTGRATTGEPVMYTQGNMAVPYPSGMSETPVSLDHLPPFPDGIRDVEMWSRTLIAFGMYDKTKTSYLDLVTSNEERKVAYVKWCRSRKNAKGQLKDLCDFLMHYFADESGNQTTMMIPGTNQARVLLP